MEKRPIGWSKWQLVSLSNVSSSSSVNGENRYVETFAPSTINCPFGHGEEERKRQDRS